MMKVVDCPLHLSIVSCQLGFPRLWRSTGKEKRGPKSTPAHLGIMADAPIGELQLQLRPHFVLQPSRH